MTESPLGNSVQWLQYPWSFYQWISGDREKQQFKSIFDVICNTNNLPTIVHCVYGKDRTGTLCYILEGILGISDEDKLKDWEVSAFWFNDMRFTHERGLDGLITYLKTFEAQTLNECCVIYAKSCGITQAEIDRFRELMLEDVNE